MPPSETEEAPEHPPATRFTTAAIVATVLAAVWMAALIAMAIWASNPVTLNRQQVLHALRDGVVVRARVLDVATGRCEAIEQWPAAEVGDTFEVANLKQTEAEAGHTYLLPLLPSDGGYAVAATLLPGGMPLIYPDTPEALAQLQELRASSASHRSAQTGVSQAH